MIRWIVAAVAVVLAISLLGGSAVVASAEDLRQRAADLVRGSDSRGQSGAQISIAEFLGVPRGLPKSRVRALLGEPEATWATTVEGVEIECWTYGIAGGTGAFQFCFANGRLSSRFRYA